MKPPRLDYVRCLSADHALELTANHGDAARILAGGQSLMPMLNMRLVSPGVLLDISRCADLAHHRVIHQASGMQLEVGAAVTQSQLLAWPELAQRLPLLAQAMPFISHWQIRNRGTVCGSVAHADPSAELPLCLVALQGEVVLRSPHARRTVTAEHFFTGLLSTARAADELVEAVRWPLAHAEEGFGFAEFARRRGDFALCAVAAHARPGRLRVAVGGVADLPLAEDWPELSGTALHDALNALAWRLDAREDSHMSAAGRRHLVRQLGLEAIQRARQAALPSMTRGARL